MGADERPGHILRRHRHTRGRLQRTRHAGQHKQVERRRVCAAAGCRSGEFKGVGTHGSAYACNMHVDASRAEFCVRAYAGLRAPAHRRPGRAHPRMWAALSPSLLARSHLPQMAQHPRRARGEGCVRVSLIVPMAHVQGIVCGTRREEKRQGRKRGPQDGVGRKRPLQHVSGARSRRARRNKV